MCHPKNPLATAVQLGRHNAWWNNRSWTMRRADSRKCPEEGSISSLEGDSKGVAPE